jgi:hypothetical protein
LSIRLGRGLISEKLLQHGGCELATASAPMGQTRQANVWNSHCVGFSLSAGANRESESKGIRQKGAIDFGVQVHEVRGRKRRKRQKTQSPRQSSPLEDVTGRRNGLMTHRAWVGIRRQVPATSECGAANASRCPKSTRAGLPGAVIRPPEMFRAQLLSRRQDV